MDESRPVEVQGENLDAAGDPDTCIGVGEQTWNSEHWISRKKKKVPGTTDLSVAKVSCKLWRGVRSFGRINVERVLAYSV